MSKNQKIKTLKNGRVVFRACLMTFAFVLAATPAGAVEGLFFAVVGLVVVDRRLNFNVFKKTAAVPNLTL